MSEVIYKITLTGYGSDGTYSKYEKSRIEVIKYPVKSITKDNIICHNYNHRIKKDSLGQIVTGNINNTVGWVRFLIFVDNEDAVPESVERLREFTLKWLESSLKSAQRTIDAVTPLGTYEIIDSSKID